MADGRRGIGADAPAQPRPRVVLLGASNVARGLAPAVAALCRVDPRRIFIAAGRGRAYSVGSSLLSRGLSSIRGCALWPRLEQELNEGGADDAELFAILTDLGNDLVYGASVDQTLDAVAEIIERLRGFRAKIALTPLPLVSLERFPAFWLEAVRRIVFPASPLTIEVLVERTHRLDERIRLLAADLDLGLVEQEADWYGLDPIHQKFSRQAEAFAAMTGAWQTQGTPRRCDLTLRRQLLSAWPQHSNLFGRPRYRRQPSARLRDGTELFFF